MKKEKIKDQKKRATPLGGGFILHHPPLDLTPLP